VRRAAVSTFAALLLLSAPAEAARGPEGDDLRVVRVDTAHGPDVTVDVIVPRPSTGRDLPASAFEVMAAGESVPVRVTRLAPADLDVMIAIGSPAASSGDVLLTLQAATTELIRTLPDGARVGFAGRGAAPSVALTPDRGRVLEALAQLGVEDVGGLGDAVGDAAHALQTRVSRRPVIVVISHGGDLDPGVLSKAVAGFATAEPLILSVVLAGAEHTGDLAAVELPGGGVARAAPLSGLVGATDAVVADLVGRYRLQFELPVPTPTDVEIRLADGAVTRRAPVLLGPAASDAAVGTRSQVSNPGGGEGSSGPSRLAYVVVGVILLLLGSWVIGMSAPPSRGRESVAAESRSAWLPRSHPVGGPGDVGGGTVLRTRGDPNRGRPRHQRRRSRPSAQRRGRSRPRR